VSLRTPALLQYFIQDIVVHLKCDTGVDSRTEQAFCTFWFYVTVLYMD